MICSKILRRPAGRSLPTQMASRGVGFVVGLLVLATVTCGGGCGRSGPPPRKMASVSGTVMLDGKPLPDGFVTFVSPTEGHFEAFEVKEGAFAGKAGLGSRRVEIIATRDVQPVATTRGPERPPQPTQENYLPAKYSTASTLSADVTESGPNVFMFELTMGK